MYQNFVLLLPIKGWGSLFETYIKEKHCDFPDIYFKEGNDVKLNK